MMRTILSITVLFYSAIACSQQVFFKSKQSFAEKELAKFYSSVTVAGDMILFNACDYNLYAYDLQSVRQLWATNLGYKTNKPVFVSNNRIYAHYYENERENTAILDAGNGAKLKVLPLGPLETTPREINGILYGTAIYDGGCVFAYNIKGDSVDWYRFIAHGVSTQPYYGEKEIWANAEADNWFRIDYKGRLLDTTCKVKADMFVQDIPCIDQYRLLSHDKKQVKTEQLQKLFDGNSVEELQSYFTAKNSFLLNEDQLIILSDKLKTKNKIDITDLSDSLRESEGAVKKILKADDKRVWLLYNNWFVVYNYNDKKLEKELSLSQWEPHQAVVDDQRLWIISRKDGLLYGVNIN
ncbi:MAG TPA: hypothetical protein VHM26_17520 [Chitinophagaceae bacterium]|jgi:hypothetical protein|nr:hypothetical protein [Chitinophagaceae bacterium]